MPDVIVNISACAGVSVRVDQRLDVNGRQVLHVSIDEAPNFAGALATVEEQIAAAIKADTATADGAFSDVLAKHYGISRNSRSNMALSSTDTSERDAKPSSISRSFSVSMALRSLQAKINAPIRSITVIKALLVDFTTASRFGSSIRRLLVGKHPPKPMSNVAVRADDSGKADNA